MSSRSDLHLVTSNSIRKRAAQPSAADHRGQQPAPCDCTGAWPVQQDAEFVSWQGPNEGGRPDPACVGARTSPVDCLQPLIAITLSGQHQGGIMKSHRFILLTGGHLAVASRRGKNDVDTAVDLHGLTVEQLRHALQRHWPAWRGMASVRIVHGQGQALRPAVVRWCEEMGIVCIPDSGNPGSVRIFPTRRTLPDNPLKTTLKDYGLA